MAEPKIEVRKIRDFSANLSETFEFIRQNLKPLVVSFFAISGIFILLQAVVSGIFTSQVLSGLTLLRGESQVNPDVIVNLYRHYFSFTFLLFFLFVWLAYVAMHVSVGAYLKYYDEHDGAKPGLEEVWRIFSRYYLKVLVYSIPAGLILALGLFCCILPGIFLAIVLVPYCWVIMIEDVSVGDALRRCFELIRNEFWISLLIYLVAGLIYTVATWMIGLSVGLISWFLSYVTTGDHASSVLIVTSILKVFRFLFYIVFLVSAMLHYYNLVEKRDAVGMNRRISKIGQVSSPGGDEREESY